MREGPVLGGGWWVSLESAPTLQTIYCHTSRIYIRSGRQGQLLPVRLANPVRQLYCSQRIKLISYDRHREKQN